MAAPLHVILNPASGGGAGRRLRNELERELRARGLAFELSTTTAPGHAAALAADAAAAGAGTIVAAGGDGTIHEVANGILSWAGARGRGGIDVPRLGVIPIGTGNDFAKLLASGADRAAAYDVLAAGRLAAFDVGRVEWQGGSEYFVNGMGTGIDVEVVRQMERLPRLPGMLSYLIALLRSLARFRAIPLRIRLDREALERRVMIVAIGNGPCLGGGFWVCPGARPSDGLFDVCIVDQLTLPQIARVLPRVMRGTHVGHPRVSLRRACEISVESAGGAPLFFHLDGELREPPGATRIRVSVEPGALRVVGGRPAGVAARPGPFDDPAPLAGEPSAAGALKGGEA